MQRKDKLAPPLSRFHDRLQGQVIVKTHRGTDSSQLVGLHFQYRDQVRVKGLVSLLDHRFDETGQSILGSWPGRLPR